MGIHRHLGAFARFTRDRLDLDDALIDFRHLFFKQALDKRRIRTGNEHLGTLGLLVDLDDDHTDAFPFTVSLIWHLLVLRHHRQRLSDIDDAEFLLHGLDRAIDHLIDLIAVFLINDLFLRFTDLLFHDVLGQDDRCTSKLLNVDLFIHQIAQLIVLGDCLCIFQRDLHLIIFDFFNDLPLLVYLDCSAAFIDIHAHQRIRDLNVLAIGLDQCFLQCADDDFFRQLAVIFDCLHGIYKHVQFHLPITSLYFHR